MPEGWYKGVLEWAVFLPGGNRDMSVAFSAADNLYVDPCQPTLGLRQPAVGPSVADLVAAAGTIPGVRATAPVDVNVGGFAARRLDLTTAAALPSCDPEPSMWQLPDGAGGPPIPDPGGTVRLWIVDVGGTRLAVAASWQSTSTAEQLAQIESVVGSIRIASPATP